uniref:Polysaccharide biosynthesis protein n=1 Tax=Geobacter sp. (strain M21) TaxID=443144 RepID=C6DZV4_GEOSM
MSFLKKSAATLLTQVFLIVLGMASGILVARVLGPDLKGKAALLSNVVQMLSMIGGLGIGSSCAFFIARKQYRPGQIILLSLYCSLAFGAVTTALFFLSYPLHKKVWDGIPFVLVSSTALLTVSYILLNYLVRVVAGYDKIYEMNAVDLVKAVLGLFFTYLLIEVMQLKLTGFVVSLYLAVLVQGLFLFWVLRKDLTAGFRLPGGMLKSSIDYGLKSYGILVINFLNYRLDMFLLKYFKSSEEVGYYSLAVGMAELLWLMPNSTIAPLFNRIASGENKDKSLLTVRTCRWSLYSLIAISALLLFCGRFFIELLYGADYLPSYQPFMFLLPGVCLFPVYKLLVVDLAARGMPGYGTITSVVALIANVGFNLILIPRFGTVGAAVSSSISYSLMSLLSIIFFMKVSGLPLSKIFLIDRVEIDFIRNLLPFAKGEGRR